jgi:dephospho-CoA kinase
MRHIGLSGGIGSGKSTVAKALEHMGYPVFYSDEEAKKLYETHPLLINELIAIFGKEIYQEGVFQKHVLATQLFENPALKEQIAALVHPLVRERFNEWAGQQTAELVFNEAAILFETGAYKQFAATVLVVAPLETRIQRVQKRDAMSREAVLQRIENQWPDSKKMNLTPYIITNDGQPLLLQIEDVISKLKTAEKNSEH